MSPCGRVMSPFGRVMSPFGRAMSLLQNHIELFGKSQKTSLRKKKNALSENIFFEQKAEI